jgi:hypothetical protein
MTSGRVNWQQPTSFLHVDAAPVGAKYGALIVLSGTRALPVRETPAEVVRRFLELGAGNIGSE